MLVPRNLYKPMIISKNLIDMEFLNQWYIFNTFRQHYFLRKYFFLSSFSNYYILPALDQVSLLSSYLIHAFKNNNSWSAVLHSLVKLFD